MNLDFFNDLINKVKESDFVQNFMTELSNYLEKNIEKGDNKMEMEKDNNSLNNYKEENCLYQVVDFSSDGVYLQNTNNNIIFEETNMPQEIKDKIGTDYILRYSNGTYIIEDKLTEDFMNSMVGIQEYKKIQEEFIKDSGISNIEANTIFKVSSRENDYTMLSYGEKNEHTLKVPNALIPYFIDEQSILCYKDGKFEKIINS